MRKDYLILMEKTTNNEWAICWSKKALDSLIENSPYDSKIVNWNETIKYSDDHWITIDVVGVITHLTEQQLTHYMLCMPPLEEEGWRWRVIEPQDFRKVYFS